MSLTHTEIIPGEDAPPSAKAPTRASARWLKRIALLLILFWIASEAISLSIQHTSLRNVLTAHLQSAFGRPVDVGRYNFSLLDGLALEASPVTVREDPRFGQEYFLRADSMAVRLRWLSLLRGRVEFGTLSLSHPSLNLVRNSVGDWNVTEWLPQPNARPSSPVPVGPAFPSSSLRFRRIDVDEGRINFKNGDEKLPFAFVGVNGTVETDRPGRWRVNLDAAPWRAAVIMQQAGTLHLSGDFGGTSSRLRPAALDLSWSDAPISDLFRLIHNDDLGVRGALNISVDARTDDAGDGWTITTRAQAGQIHRRDLPLRPDNPSLNLDARLAWIPSEPYLEITQATLAAPHSRINANGRLYWRHEPPLTKRMTPPAQVVNTDADVDIRDLLAWASAFHSGIAGNLDVRGLAHTHVIFAEWPPHVVSASISSNGADFSSPGLRRPVHLGDLSLRYENGSVSFPPLAIDFGAPDDALRFDSLPKPNRAAENTLHMTANVSDVHDVIAMASALGWNLSRGWDVSGPVRADLSWQGPEYPWKTAPVGYINWGAGPGVAVLRVPFLNQPVDGINAVSEWKPGSRHVALASAEAFGAHWSGSFDRRDPAGDWQFALAADHLSAADLDRWLNPAWRESFLDRMLPFLNSRSAATAAPESLRAAGRITIDQFTLAPLAIHKLEGDLKIDGRHIAFEKAAGQFYGGQVEGSLAAALLAAPAYRADLAFSHIDGAAFAAATPALAGVTAKTVAGQISITTTGTNRAALLDSLACQGNATANALQLIKIDLPKFASTTASFSCAQRKIDFQTLALTETMNGSGSVDFSRNINLQFPTGSPAPFRLGGTLSTPVVIPTPATPRRSR